jgi:hypothetical protein
MRRAEGAPSIDEALPPDGTSHELVVVFRPSRGEEQSEQVRLAPTGPTRVVTFRFEAGAAGVGVHRADRGDRTRTGRCRPRS